MAEVSTNLAARYDPRCLHCGHPEGDLGCKVTRYCSWECQNRAWKSHKEFHFCYRRMAPISDLAEGGHGGIDRPDAWPRFMGAYEVDLLAVCRGGCARRAASTVQIEEEERKQKVTRGVYRRSYQKGGGWNAGPSLSLRRGGHEKVVK
ncbi:hypothetical protein PLICRDRAFT_37440 [Plicaturopsis crispa FD-325 SS-3]|nr:hypothetical protein PLICRDRAFT_37440 [Plicaturopsis crispa FD-325 SS-3]